MSPSEEEEIKAGVTSGLRLEKASVGVSAIAGLLLMVLIALVSDVRGSISALVVKVDQSLRDVAVLQAQTLDGRLRILESTATRNVQRIEYLERECERVLRAVSTREPNGGGQ